MNFKIDLALSLHECFWGDNEPGEPLSNYCSATFHMDDFDRLVMRGSAFLHLGRAGECRSIFAWAVDEKGGRTYVHSWPSGRFKVSEQDLIDEKVKKSVHIKGLEIPPHIANLLMKKNVAPATAEFKGVEFEL